MSARIVDGEEAERVRSTTRPRKQEAEIAALLRGEVVHFDDLVAHFNPFKFHRRYGVRLRQKPDGHGGRYYWTES